jgi:uncharacterized membrane protein YgdD (TMEM256/DUF423 family)
LFLNGSTNLQTKTRNRLSYLFFLGILFFSGSIFAISLDLIPASSIWFITPLGGLLLIAGWIGLAFAFLSQSSDNKND